MSGDIDTKIEALTQFVKTGLNMSIQTMAAMQPRIQMSDIANYKGHTGAGKARFVASLVESMGSQQAVAHHLKLTKGRVSQLVKSAKKNGK